MRSVIKSRRCEAQTTERQATQQLVVTHLLVFTGAKVREERVADDERRAAREAKEALRPSIQCVRMLHQPREAADAEHTDAAYKRARADIPVARLAVIEA